MKKTNRRSKQSPIDDASAPVEKEKQIYEERIRELERENKAYRAEIAELKQGKGNEASASNKGFEKLKKDYLQKLNLLEEQVAELKKKLGSQSQFSTRRKGIDESTKQLQFEIQSLKAQKVQLQCKMKLESVQFRLCKALLEKEVLQLKKEGRRNEFKAQHLLASNERLKMVLQRKTEEAFTATKLLREMIESRKLIANRSNGARNRNSQVIQDAEREIELTSQLHKLCSEYETQMEEMAEEIAKLNEEIEMQKQEKLRSQLPEDESARLEKDFNLQDLKDQMNGLGCLLRELQLRKENLDFKDKKQVLSQPLFPNESNRKLMIKMDTPETNSSSENNAKRESTAEGLCCSCSKKSLCKTTKCKCRSAGGSCGPSCGCTSFKCTNRELSQMEGNEPLKSGSEESNTNSSAIDEDGSMIASECAKLLQSALVQKASTCIDNPGEKKKPLCDIQNSLGNLDAQKPGKKKRVRKPVIHVVTNDPMSSSPENSSSTEAYKIESQENNPVGLEKGKKSGKQSNSGQPNELATAISDTAGLRQSRNPPRQAKTLVANKENCYI